MTAVNPPPPDEKAKVATPATPATSHLDTWVSFLTAREIPVLRQTEAALAKAKRRLDRLGVRDIANIVLHDPLMTLRVLRFTGQRRGKRQLQEISNVEHAVMMIGVEPFFHHFSQLQIVEDQLKPHPQALLSLLRLVQRSRRAARHALDWAVWRQDLNSEEVAVATLLQDFAEMLVLCMTPNKALQIDALRIKHPQATEMQVQRAVMGTHFAELHARLCKEWKMSDLLLNLVDAAHAGQARVKNVKLAKDLAIHAADGWDTPTVEEDFKAIAGLMNIDDATLRLRLGLKPRKEEPR
jgi:HD-like signal output (HDOD) protein